MIKIMLIEDHAIVRAGIRQLLSKYGQMEVIGEFTDPKDLLEALPKQQPDVLLCDINLPEAEADGLALISDIKAEYPNVKVAVLSMHKEEFYVMKAVQANADGYLHKDILEDELIEGVRRIYEGERYFSQVISQLIINNMFQKGRRNNKKGQPPTLTPREKEVLKLITEGNSNREIGDRLHISFKTVDCHRTNILKKFQLKNTAELVRFTIENKLI